MITFSPAHPRLERSLLALILLGYLLVAGAFALFTPDWQAPDEPAHYNYAAQVAARGCCPLIEPGDWDSAYLDELKAARFAPDLLDRLATVQYEDHQPPLYYLLAGLVFRWSGGSLTALRLLSVGLGLGIVLVTWVIGRALMPARPGAALGAATLVAFLPQQVAVLASVNNDALANLLIGLSLLAAVVHLKTGRPPGWLMGLLVGLGLLTKVSTLFLLALVPLALLLRGWSTGRSPRRLVRELAAFLMVALLLGGLWWARNASVYGFPDLFGLGQHNRVVADQPRTADLIARIGFGPYLSSAFQTTFNSFWGQFGWMALPLPEWIYRLIQGLLVLCGLGLLGQMVGLARGRVRAPVWERDSWLILLLTIGLALLAYIYYNTEFLQFQGRYLYAGLIPFALVLALGLDLLIRWVGGRLKVREDWLAYAVLIPFAAFAPLDLYLLRQVIVPLLRP